MHHKVSHQKLLFDHLSTVKVFSVQGRFKTLVQDTFR
jgi:hypothetical protein